MASLFRLGQLLRGSAGTYTIQKQLHESIWLATSHSEQTIVIKSVRHFRLDNERAVLKRFQARTSSLRPLIDEIHDPPDTPALVLRHLDDDLRRASASQRLTKSEIKYVAKSVLEALKLLHEEHYVHTDIKLDNVLVNYGKGNHRFTDVQLGDLGNTVPDNSPWARDCDMIGAPIWRSPEAMLQIGWGTPTDIWSFGAMLIALIYGDDWFVFKPDVPADHEEYELRILMRQHQFFGPFPASYGEIANDEVLAILDYVMDSVPPEKTKPFGRIAEREVSKEDKTFLLKIMKLDPRDRPTAKQLAEDEWFKAS
ncbi:hypothetical protein AYO20_09782 [Fonsecaea nubica]|uniref:Protein kinase domain-containing protein n=1 Tax=Fonsecaea nubica TaxID=856822 RepID=A0A178CC18_9EURO|nr:hypothetical protein AYO20_09782 [Fonsecaea nubica]OAL27499.1 hypothetical protein AYO20_09782 [Fonsecaea nubica]